MVTEAEEFISSYERLEADMFDRKYWGVIGLGGVATGAAVTIVSGDLLAGAIIASASVYGVQWEFIKAHIAIRRHKKAIAGSIFR